MNYAIISQQNGKHDEGWMILKQVHDTNMRAKGHPEKVFSVSISETHIHVKSLNLRVLQQNVFMKL